MGDGPLKRIKAFLAELREAMASVKNLHVDISTLRTEMAALRLDLNALRVAQAKAQHRLAAEVAPETLGKPFGLTKDQAEQVDWSRVR